MRDNKYICNYCDEEFSSQAVMLRHQNKCKNDEILKLKLSMEHQQKQIEIENRLKQTEMESKIKQAEIESKLKQVEMENKLKQTEMENEIKILKIKLENSELINKTSLKDKAETIEILKNQSTIATKSVSALIYLATKHKNAPPLLQIKHKDAKKLLLKYGKDKEVTNKILCKYVTGVLDEFIGDIIVSHYKKNNPEDQSIWNSDASRLTFLIKDIVGEKSKWTFTKAEALAPVLCDC